MRHSLLRDHLEKDIIFKRLMYRKDIQRTYLNNLTNLISSDVKKEFSISFYDACNFRYQRRDC